MSDPFGIERRRRPRRIRKASPLLEVDAWVDSTAFTVWNRFSQFWEGLVIASRRMRSTGWRRGLSELASEGFTLGVVGAMLMLLLALPAFKETEGDWRKLDDYAVTFLDRYGNVIGQRGIIQRDSVPVDQLPDHVIKAVLATEDRRFFEHYGIDFVGLVRAMNENVRANSVVQGGSSGPSAARDARLSAGFRELRGRLGSRRLGKSSSSGRSMMGMSMPSWPRKTTLITSFPLLTGAISVRVKFVLES